MIQTTTYGGTYLPYFVTFDHNNILECKIHIESNPSH
jgi:hypothetical protein